MKPLSDCRLYTFVDTAYLRGRKPEWVVEQLCAGGSELIQLRAKGASPDDVRRMAEAILPVTRKAGVGLVINDHLDIATETGAELCHLGQEDFFDAGHTHVSQLFGAAGQRPSAFELTDKKDPPPTPAAGTYSIEGATSPQPSPPLRGGEGEEPPGHALPLSPMAAGRSVQPLIGLSTHSSKQARRALAAGPAYIAVGPVYATRTKPGAQPVTLEYVRWAAANVNIPWFAIGGINPGNVREVLAAGARRICMVSAILDAPDIAEACREMRREIESFV